MANIVYHLSNMLQNAMATRPHIHSLITQAWQCEEHCVRWSLRKDKGSFEDEEETAIASDVVLQRNSQLATILIGSGSSVSQGKKLRHGVAFHRERVTAVGSREGREKGWKIQRSEAKYRQLRGTGRQRETSSVCLVIYLRNQKCCFMLRRFKINSPEYHWCGTVEPVWCSCKTVKSFSLYLDR